MAVTPTRLYDISAETLVVINTVFAGAGIALPDRQYVHQGQIASDCEQVVVTLLRVFTGSPGAEEATAEHCGGKRTAEYEVRIERCVPTMDDEGNPPSAAALDASALELNTDAWVLVSGLVLAYHERPRTWLSDCQPVSIGNATAIGPTGVMGGIALTLEVGI